MGELILASLLYEALASPHGICVETTDAERLRQKLYPERKKSPDFLPLSFIISPMNGVDLWIVNRGTSDGE